MKRLFKSAMLAILLVIVAINATFSQQEVSYIANPVSLSQYLRAVMKGNLGYIAGQFNVGIAEAELKASKIFPDPEVSITYANNEDKRLRMGQSVETGISYPVNLGNKRGAGIALARSQHELSQLMLDAYFQNLRADATLSYFASLRNRKIYLLQKDIYEQLSGLARADSIRLHSGESTDLDALQSSLEARSQQTEVYQSFAEMQNTSFLLMLLQGKVFSDTLDHPSDSFPYKQRDLDLMELINNAIQNRADLLLAVKNREVSEKNLQLLKANRAFEFSLEAGYSYNAIVENEIAPAPAFNGLSAGISIPLKFSGLNKGPLQAASLALQQSQISYQDLGSDTLMGFIN